MLRAGCSIISHDPPAPCINVLALVIISDIDIGNVTFLERKILSLRHSRQLRCGRRGRLPAKSLESLESGIFAVDFEFGNDEIEGAFAEASSLSRRAECEKGYVLKDLVIGRLKCWS